MTTLLFQHIPTGAANNATMDLLIELLSDQNVPCICTLVIAPQSMHRIWDQRIGSIRNPHYRNKTWLINPAEALRLLPIVDITKVQLLVDELFPEQYLTLVQWLQANWFDEDCNPTGTVTFTGCDAFMHFRREHIKQFPFLAL